MIQGTRPYSLSSGLNDSPAGLAAWIVEKFQRWSDCGGQIETRFTKDELLTNIMIYWATETIGSSFLPYYDFTGSLATISVPFSVRCDHWSPSAGRTRRKLGVDPESQSHSRRLPPGPHSPLR